jgi:hypothetical protein
MDAPRDCSPGENYLATPGGLFEKTFRSVGKIFMRAKNAKKAHFELFSLQFADGDLQAKLEHIERLVIQQKNDFYADSLFSSAVVGMWIVTLCRMLELKEGNRLLNFVMIANSPGLYYPDPSKDRFSGRRLHEGVHSDR